MTSYVLITACYLAVINLTTWMFYWYDKQSAIQGNRRVSERRLLTLAALGGTPAAHAARRYYRHKTLKQPFRRHMQRITRWHTRLSATIFIVLIISVSQTYMLVGQ